MALRHLATVPARERNWAALIERMAAGDGDALAALYDDTAPLVHGLALRILGDRSAAEEATADAYVQAWQQAARYERGRGGPLAWLLMLARSRALDRRRSGALARAASEPEDAAAEVPAPTAGPEENAEVAERRRLVQGALARLVPEQRQVVELAYFGGLSHAEIATALAQPLGTVKTRIRLGMARLRDALAGAGKECL